MLGRLGTEAGVMAMWWHDGKARPVAVKADTTTNGVLVFDAKGVKAARGYEPSMPLIAQSGGTRFAPRVGAIMVGGKVKKQGGLFKSGPKPERAVCLDTGGDTILQFEFSSAAEAEELLLMLEQLAHMAA